MTLAETRVLIIDDEAFMRSTLRRMLKLLGCEMVETAESGEQAFDIMETFKPDAIVCDVSMKPMNGLVFTEKLRSHERERLRETPVLILTGSSDAEVVQDALRLGVSAYMLKPVSTKVLGERLRAILSAR